MATLLAMERSVLYPALSHEATCFVGRTGTQPQEVVRVVGPLAAAVLLQPECERWGGRELSDDGKTNVKRAKNSIKRECVHKTKLRKRRSGQ